MRVLAACSLGGAGHLLPLAPFLEAAGRRGDTCAVLAPTAMASQVESLGVRCFAGDEPPESEVAPIREQLPVAPPETARVLAERELFARLAASALLPRASEVFTSWRPGLLLREPCEYASILACPPGVAAAQVAITFARGEARCLEVAAPALEAQREGVVEAIRSTPYLTRLPASLDPSPWATTLRYRPPSPQGGGRLPDWWGGCRDPLVYVTLGTVTGHLAEATAIYRVVLDAVAGLPVRVLLTTGRHLDPGALGRLPASVHVEAWVDQADVLAEAAAVLCHGGSGTVWGALAAGVPVVVVPGFADQAENGRLVAETGAGLVVEVLTGPEGRRRAAGPDEVPAIAEAMGRVLAGEGAFRAAARELAAEMAAAPPIEAVLARLTAAARQPGRRRRRVAHGS